VERRLYRRLSRYYLPLKGGDEAEWTRPPLLQTGKYGHVLLPTLRLPKLLVLKDLEDLEDSGSLEGLGDLKTFEDFQSLQRPKDLEDLEDL